MKITPFFPNENKSLFYNKDMPGLKTDICFRGMTKSLLKPTENIKLAITRGSHWCFEN